MANEKQEVAQWEINDWSVIKSTYTPFEGEIVYFENVINGQLNIVSVIGDGTNLVSGLYFKDVLEISSASSVDIQDLRVSGNRVKVYNSGSSTIEIEIGITASSIKFYLLPKNEVNLFFNGSVWIHNEPNVITMPDSNLVLNDLSGPTRVIMPSSGITANRTLTLPTLSDNQYKKIKLDNQNTTYALYVDGESAETIEGLQTINISNEWRIIEAQLSEWKQVESSPIRPRYHYQDQKAASTDGGTNVATTWTKRICDDLVENSIIGASESSSVHTLPPGIYSFFIQSPFYRVGSISLRLRNTSDSTDPLYNVNDYGNTTNGNAVATIIGKVTITAQKQFEIQYYVDAVVSGNGLGVQKSSGTINTFTNLIIDKLV